MCNLFLFIVAGLAVLVSCRAPAVVASFHCGRSVTEREKLVCGDAKLSEADSGLSRDYVDALARVSPESAGALRSDQRAWLRFIDAACPLPKQAGEDGPKDSRFCLHGEYTRRDARLREEGVQVGAFRFVNRNTYWAIPLRPACDNSDENTNQKGGMEQDWVTYPQIDSPPDEQTRKWNEIARTTAEKLRGIAKEMVVSVNYEIGLANSRFISLVWWRGWCNGTRRCGGESQGQTIVLRPRPHPLVAADLFRADRDWGRKLQDVAVAAARRTDQGSSLNFPFDLFKSATVDPSHWVLRTDGLAILTSDPDTFGPCGVCEVLLPWSDLRDILVRPPLFST